MRKLRVLKGFYGQSEEKILKGIELPSKRSDDRTPLAKRGPLALSLVAGRAALPENTIQQIEVAGSLRRWCRRPFGDVDIVCVSEQPAAVMAAFSTLAVDSMMPSPTPAIPNQV
ncbi:MAG: hypothetical protein R3E79_14395 [Caldilineaceae bacterium]